MTGDDSAVDDVFWNDLWESSAHNHYAWAYRASILISAANRLRRGAFRKHPQTREVEPFSPLLGPMMMLYGMGIECLLSGVAAKKGFVFVESEKKGKKGLRFKKVIGNPHCLVQLARAPKIRVKLSTAEEELLERLGHYVRFAGRYPVAMTPCEGLLWKRGSYRPNLDALPTDKAILDPLVKRLFVDLHVELDRDGIAELPDSL